MLFGMFCVLFVIFLVKRSFETVSLQNDMLFDEYGLFLL